MKKILASILAAACVLVSASVPMPENTVAADGFVIEQDAQTAMEKNKTAVLEALDAANITNETTREDIEDIIMGACNYSTDQYIGAGFEMVDFKQIRATETKSGSISAAVILSQDDGEVAFAIKKTIPVLSGSSDTNTSAAITAQEVKKILSEALGKAKVSNGTTKNDIAAVIDKTDLEGIAVLIEEFKVAEASQSTQGSIDMKCTITLADNTEIPFEYQWTLDTLTSGQTTTNVKQELEKASKAISDAIWTFEVSNDTTPNDILNMAKKAIGSDSSVTVTLDSNDFSLIPSTTTLNGTLSATLTLECEGQIKRCPIGKTVSEVVTENSTKIDEDRSAMSHAIRSMTHDNKLTKESMLQTALSASKNGSTAEWKSFIKKEATFQEAGAISGELILTFNEETRVMEIHETLPKLVRKMPTDKITVNAEEWEVLRLVNVERAQANDYLLTMAAPLQDACNIREREISTVFSHTRPDGTKFNTAISSSFKTAGAGENIYQCSTGYANAQRAMVAWMDSTGHRENILRSNYDYLGVGLTNTDAVQIFAAWKSPIVSVTTSAGTMQFEDEDAMQKEYLICTSGDGVETYMPLDVSYMTKSGNEYTVKLQTNENVVLTVNADGKTAQNNDSVSTNNSVSFADVSSDAYYAQAVEWAVNKKITAGTSATTFSPDDTCTRAQILTFLWRAVGSPKATAANPFKDVSENDYYYDAVIWASEKGMITGDSFKGDTPCTRAATVTYLWQNAGSPETFGTNRFDDVPVSSDYVPAINWALANGVTSGTSADTFSPLAVCSRGQIVTFLKRAIQ